MGINKNRGGLTMTGRTLILGTLMVSFAGAGLAVPAEAMTAIAEHASGAVRYLDEAVIALVALIAAVLLDTASWSFMTTRR